MLTRYFKLRNFKNIGCSKNGTELNCNCLYHTNQFEYKLEGKLNGINVLIGLNNTGKSNILEAIDFTNSYQNLKSNKFNWDEDKPMYVSNPDKFEISCVIRDGNFMFEHGVGYDFYSHHNYEINNSKQLFSKSEKELLRSANKIISAIKKSESQLYTKEIINKLLNDFSEMESPLNDDVLRNILDMCHSSSDSNINLLSIDDIESAHLIYVKSKCIFSKEREYLNDYFKCGIYYYRESKMNNAETTINISKNVTTYNNEVPQNIPSLIFDYLGYNIVEISSWFNGKKSKKFYTEKSKEVTEKLSAFCSDFNKMFPSESSDDKYKFEIKIESKKIDFLIYVNGKEMPLYLQSEGFRYFFEFYCMLYLNKFLQKGYIVLIDEPCTKLHPKGIQEFRKLLNLISDTYEVTFIIVTHSPFLIDVDHLEEVRIVQEKNSNVVIKNFFNEVDTFDSNAFSPIFNAILTDKNDIYDNTKNKIVFVEGISDYLFLTGFKEYISKKLGKQYNLVFIPLNGIDANNSESKVNHALSIQSLSFILVDGDKTGKDFQKNYHKVYNKKTRVITLNNISHKFEEIETLFIHEDRLKFDMYPPKTDKSKKLWKECPYSIGIKKAIVDGKMSEGTVKNFMKVLDYLENGKMNVKVNFRRSYNRSTK